MTGSEQKVVRKRSPVSGRRSSGSRASLSSFAPPPPLLSTRQPLTTMNSSSSVPTPPTPSTSPRESLTCKCNETEIKNLNRMSSHVCGTPMRGEPMRGEPMRGEPMRGEPLKSVITTEGYNVPQYVYRNISVVPHGRHASLSQMNTTPPTSPSLGSSIFGSASWYQVKRSSQTLTSSSSFTNLSSLTSPALSPMSPALSPMSPALSPMSPALSQMSPILSLTNLSLTSPTLSSTSSSLSSSSIAIQPPGLDRGVTETNNLTANIDMTLADEITDLLRGIYDQPFEEKLKAVVHVCNDYFVNILIHEYEWIGSNLQAPVRLKKQILEILNCDNFYGIQKKLDEIERLIRNNNHASLSETASFEQISNYTKFEYLNMSAVSVLGRFLKNEISLIDTKELGLTKEKFEDYIRISLRENIPIIIGNFKHKIAEKNNEYKQLVLNISAVIEKGRGSYLYNKESIISDFLSLTDSLSYS
jgi:hypothetical protein